MTITFPIGKAIRIVRMASGLKNYELSISANVSKGMVSEIETGKRNPSIMTLRSISVALKIQTWELVAIADSLATGTIIQQVPNEFHRALSTEIQRAREVA